MNANVRKVYVFSFFWMFLIIIPVIIPYYLSLGLSMGQIFQLQSIFGISMALCEIPTGYICDLWGRKNALCVGAFFSGCGFTLLNFVHTFPGLVCFEILLAIGSSLVSGADVSFMYDSLDDPKSNRAQGTHAFANIQLAQVSAESIASILGGFLVTYSFRHALIAHAIVGWFPFLVALTLKEPSYPKLASGHFGNLKRVFLHIFASDRFLTLVFVNLIVWGLSTFIAVWVFQKYWQDQNVPLAYFGVLWASYNISVGIIGKQVHWLENRLGPLPLLLFLSLAPVVGYFSLAWAAGWFGVLLGFLFYFSRGVTQVLLKDAFNWRVPSEFRATANSMYSFFFRLSFAIIGPIVGYALDRWGMSRTMSALGVAFSLLFILVLLPLARAVARVAPAYIPDKSANG